MPNTLKKFNLGVAVMAVTGMALIAVFSKGIDMFTESVEMQKQSAQTYIVSEQIIKDCLDSAYGVGGFSNTKNIEYLIPYQQGQDSFKSHIKTALTLSPKGSEEEKKFLSVKSNFDRWNMLAKNAIKPPQLDYVASRKTILSLQRKHIMDSIRSDISAIQRQEREKMDNVYATTKSRQATAGWLVGLASLGVVAGSFVFAGALMRKGEELNKNQERYTLALDASQAALWDLDLDTKAAFMSPRWKSMLGFGPTEIGDSMEIWENLVHPEDKAKVMKTLSDFIAGTTPFFDMEIRMKHKDGSYHTILTQAAALRHRDGKAYRVAGSHLDISDRKWRDAYDALILIEQREKQEKAKENIEVPKPKPAPRKRKTTPAAKPTPKPKEEEKPKPPTRRRRTT